MAEVVFYADSRGEEPVLEYIRALGKRRAAEAASVERYIDLLEEFGERLTMPYSRLIDRELRLFELRPGAHRIAYALHDRRYVLLHAWRKASQQLDLRAVAKARGRLHEWKAR